MNKRDDKAGWQASLPPRWLNDSTYKSLTVKAWTLLTWTLAWGVDQENDGRVRPQDLPFIASPMLNTDESAAAAAELVKVGLWEIVAEGYQVVNWEQSQPTSAQIEAQRATWRQRKQAKPKLLPPETPDEKTRSSTVEGGSLHAGNQPLHVRTHVRTNDKDEQTKGPRFESVPVEATGEIVDGWVETADGWVEADVDQPVVSSGRVQGWPTRVPGEPGRLAS